MTYEDARLVRAMVDKINQVYFRENGSDRYKAAIRPRNSDKCPYEVHLYTNNNGSYGRYDLAKFADALQGLGTKWCMGFGHYDTGTRKGESIVDSVVLF